MTSAVIVQMTMVSMNGSSNATTPSETGSSVLAAECAMGADPCPASFENSPRRTPHMSVSKNAPVPVPATPALGLNASRKMSPSASGSWCMFITMMRRAPSTYTAAITGASTPVTRPMRPMPPRMTMPMTADVTIPVTQAATPNSEDITSATVLACTALPVKKAVIPSSTAKNTARGFQRLPRPRSI